VDPSVMGERRSVQPRLAPWRPLRGFLFRPQARAAQGRGQAHHMLLGKDTEKAADASYQYWQHAATTRFTPNQDSACPMSCGNRHHRAFTASTAGTNRFVPARRGKSEWG
jgi:hypothetical protein